ncbi:MAG: hypothetical protein P4K98_07690 [Bryobacteraceae bacterium]|nr:hypothetical protein [Bryobacteraceae bacterium]
MKNLGLLTAAEPAPSTAVSLSPDATGMRVRDRFRGARQAAIAAYAEERAGSNDDFDPDLESAGVEHLLAHAPGIAPHS